MDYPKFTYINLSFLALNFWKQGLIFFCWNCSRVNFPAIYFLESFCRRIADESYWQTLIFLSLTWRPRLKVFFEQISTTLPPHNHGSGKWLYLKGNDPIGENPSLTSMIMVIMGESVIVNWWFRVGGLDSQDPLIKGIFTLGVPLESQTTGPQTTNHHWLRIVLQPSFWTVLEVWQLVVLRLSSFSCSVPKRSIQRSPWPPFFIGCFIHHFFK